MEKVNTKIDFTDDIVNMFGQKRLVKITTSGHYAVPLNGNRKRMKDIEAGRNVNITLFAKDPNKYKIAKKLHAQFAHPTKEK